MDKKVKNGNYPCLVENRFVRPCTSLTRALDKACPESSRAKGMYVQHILDMTTGEYSMSFVKMKLGEFLKRGVVVNVCPFCGVNISNHIKELA
jgi:hypothetical protein